jgi:hypothetical protein
VKGQSGPPPYDFYLSKEAAEERLKKILSRRTSLLARGYEFDEGHESPLRVIEGVLHD